jgi:hypothetical protein
VLDSTSFGQRIAEQETDELSTYFVETAAWKSIYAGEVDVVYGPKGSGKSALYSLLRDRADALRERRIVLISAENPSGAPVFRDLVADPPTSAPEFCNLWKLYLLSLVALALRDHVPRRNAAARAVVQALEQASLIPHQASLRSTLRSVVDYVRRVRGLEGIEAGLQLDPLTGNPRPSVRITFLEPSAADRALGQASADDLLALANAALEREGQMICLILDRLDVAFSESHELEANALAALFRVYLDLQPLRQLSLKVFLRNDIWQRVTRSGFPGASHITRALSIVWNKDSLLNLVIRRAVRNESLRRFYGVDEHAVLADAAAQESLFYRIFPPKVDRGTRTPATFVWMLLRTQDGTGHTAPRELIHLLSATRNVQRRLIDEGHKEPPGERLFDQAAISAALPEVSRERLEQTLYAEYPHLRKWLPELTRERTEQTAATLAEIWDVDVERAAEIADELVEVGFFQPRGTKRERTYWVPFLYRDALEMVQGSAD